jgi:hypothetical protein
MRWWGGSEHAVLMHLNSIDDVGVSPLLEFDHRRYRMVEIPQTVGERGREGTGREGTGREGTGREGTGREGTGRGYQSSPL